jgi:hypothetical protein
MAKRPEERYQTPAEVAVALDALFRLGNELPAPSATAIVTGLPPHALGAGLPTPPLAEPAAETPSALFGALPFDTLPALAEARRRPRPAARQRSWLLPAAGALVLLTLALLFVPWRHAAEDEPNDVKKPPQTNGGPVARVDYEAQIYERATALLGGTWYYLGPFDNAGWKGFDTAYAPEREIDLRARYAGKFGRPILWKELPNFRVSGAVNLLPLFARPDEQEWACIYLYHEMEVAEACTVPIFLGSDDTLTVWLNGACLLANNRHGGVQTDDAFVTLQLRPGKNALLLKVCQGTGAWGFAISPRKPWFYERPDFAPWLKEVAVLGPEALAEIVKIKLRECNPLFDDPVEYKTEGGAVTQLRLSTDHVTDLSPLRALTGLKHLSCAGTPTLKGVGRGQLYSLVPLQGLPLQRLDCPWTRVCDLTPLRGMPLQFLDIGHTRVNNLAPLKDLPLTALDCRSTKIADLTPLAGMPLSVLNCTATEVTDVEMLRSLPLQELSWDFKRWRDGDLLRSLKTLTKVNGKPAEQFWKEVAVQEAAFTAWCQRLAPLPGEKQVAAVQLKLKALNAGFDGVVTPTYDATGAVTGLRLLTDFVQDVSPVLALSKLDTLHCSGTPFSRMGKLADLSPLRGLGLKNLACADTLVTDLAPLREMPLEQLYLSRTPVASLAPLQGRHLTVLYCNDTCVTDLTPLRDMPLKDLRCDFRAERDTALLRTLPSLEQINGKAAAIFWKEENHENTKQKEGKTKGPGL